MSKVILIDDEEALTRLFETIFEKFDIDYIIFPSAEEFLKQKDYLLADAFLIIVDLILSGMSGIDLIKILKEERPNIPIYAISGYTSNDKDISLTQVDKFYNKPFNLFDFAEDILEERKKSEGR